MIARRREHALLALGAAALFVGCCVAVRGGPLDSHDFGDTHLYGLFGREMASGHWPYRDFYDEYPPLAQPLFLVVRLLPGTFVPGFRWTMAVLGALAVVLLVVLVATLGASRVRLVAAALAAGFAPLLVGPVFLNTYDLFPALLTVAAVLALVRGRDVAAYVLLALAVAAKIYPIALLPIALVASSVRGGRDAVRRGLVWFVCVLAVVHLPFAVTGPGGLRFSYWSQLRRGLEVESLGGAVLLALDRLGLHHVVLRDEAPGSKNVVGGLAGAVGVLSTIALVVAVLWVARRFWRDTGALALAAAAAVTAFVAFNKVFSPQYVVWLVPLVPLAGLVPVALLVAVLALTHVAWDHFVDGGLDPVAWRHALVWWVLARDLLVVALFALLSFRVGARSRSPR